MRRAAGRPPRSPFPSAAQRQRLSGQRQKFPRRQADLTSRLYGTENTGPAPLEQDVWSACPEGVLAPSWRVGVQPQGCLPPAPWPPSSLLTATLACALQGFLPPSISRPATALPQAASLKRAPAGHAGHVMATLGRCPEP